MNKYEIRFLETAKEFLDNQDSKTREKIISTYGNLEKLIILNYSKN